MTHAGRGSGSARRQSLSEAPDEKLKRRLARERPAVVVFGHTHKPFCETIGGTLFFNPGYAGKPRFKLPRSVPILHGDDGGIRPEDFEL